LTNDYWLKYISYKDVYIGGYVMKVLIEVRNRDEKNAIEKMIRGLIDLGYSDIEEFAWRESFINSTKISINNGVAPTQLPTYNICCQCISDGFVHGECDCDCHKSDVVENGQNENGESSENGDDENGGKRKK
jgi:hypothetical protein